CIYCSNVPPQGQLGVLHPFICPVYEQNFCIQHTRKLLKDHSEFGVFDAVAKGCLSELEKTLKGNDINALNSSSETLLHVAAANGHLAIMEYLISKGAKIDVKDKKGRTPLHRAAENGHGDAVKVYRNQHHFLHMAALKDESSLAKMLLKAGASVDGKNERGQTALSYAVSLGSENTAKVLLEAGASVDSNMVERAFNSNHPSICKILLEYSKDFERGRPGGAAAGRDARPAASPARSFPLTAALPLSRAPRSPVPA
uniref:Uncharacterized protein n=1 Tax=Calidris pygmaea TaxID=425635 RepID=A0A8C3K9K5_9CHAR